MLMETIIRDEDGRKPDVIIHPRSAQPDSYRFLVKIRYEDGSELYVKDSHAGGGSNELPCVQLWTMDKDGIPYKMQWEFATWIGMCDFISKGHFEPHGHPRFKAMVFIRGDHTNYFIKNSYELESKGTRPYEIFGPVEGE